MSWIFFLLGAVLLWGAGAGLRRRADRRAENALWSELLLNAGPAGPPIDISALSDLPEPAQRYFRYTIAPGTRLASVAEIEMTGQLGLGDKREPRYRTMTATQILAPPEGLVWRVRMPSLDGSDAASSTTSWTRFWLFGLIPIVRVSGNADHHRSAFGRVVAEGAFWVPASLLPGDHVSWKAVDQATARAVVTCGELSQAIDLTIEPDGRPSRVVIRRWSNANPDKQFREQPFGGYLSEFREFGGYRIPTHVEGGNLIGTDDYFPFYVADVEQVRFPQLAASPRTAQTGERS